MGLALLAATPAAAAHDHGGLRAYIGPPNAPHAMRRLDARRSSQASTRLTPEPRVARRLRVALGIGRGLVTLPDGGFFVVHQSPRASRFDQQGKLLYSVKLSGEPSSTPVVTSAGQFAFAAGGELLFVDEQGRIRQRAKLGESDAAVRSILAVSDGGVLLTSYGQLIKVGAFGEVIWRRAVSEGPFELLETRVGTVCVTLQGSVYRLDAAGKLSKLGELGGSTGSVTMSRDGASLLIRTGSHKLLAFDLSEHRVRSTIEDLTIDLDGPLLNWSDGLAQAFTSDGLLVRYRSDGSEAQRIPFDAGARKAPDIEEALLLADGSLVVARDGLDLSIINPQGEVRNVAASACPDPVGVFAGGLNSVLLACRSGNILRIE